VETAITVRHQKVLWDCLVDDDMGKEIWHDPAFKVYRGLGNVVLLLLCWGVDLHVWRSAGIDYERFLRRAAFTPTKLITHVVETVIIALPPRTTQSLLSMTPPPCPVSLSFAVVYVFSLTFFPSPSSSSSFLSFARLPPGLPGANPTPPVWNIGLALGAAWLLSFICFWKALRGVFLAGVPPQLAHAFPVSLFM